MQPSSTSGNIIADRRTEYARALSASCDYEGAADLMAQALELVPAWAAGWFFAGEQYERAGQAVQALSAFEKALRLAPHDPFGASLKIALLTNAKIDTVPLGYSAALFDDYAERFDEALVNNLGYDVPKQLISLLTSFLNKNPSYKAPFNHVIDLGCGTGLVAEALAGRAGELTGIDLSAAMIAKALKKGLYQTLVRGNISEALPASPAASLITAADVFIYIAALEPIMRAIAANLVADGLVLFSVEDVEGDRDFQLLPSLRHGHSVAYVRKVMAQYGLELLEARPSTLRMEAKRPITGHLCLGRILHG